LPSGRASAAILATGFFSGSIERFDPNTGQQSTFATVTFDAAALQPGLSAIAHDPLTGRIYVAELDQANPASGYIHSFDTSGQSLGTRSLGFGPTGISVANDGRVYVSDLGSNTVRVFGGGLGAEIGAVSVPEQTATAGVGFANNGDLIIATLGAGVFRSDASPGSTASSFAGQSAAAGQVAVDSDGSVYVGHGLGFSNNVFKFDEDGNEIDSPFLTIGDDLVQSHGEGSSFGTSPGGLAFDAEGNLIVAVLGKSNPGDGPGERGGLFKFDTSGELIEPLAQGSSAFSGVAVLPTAIPEPGSVAFLLCCSGTLLLNRRRRRR
jgi:hypothetical protein